MTIYALILFACSPQGCGPHIIGDGLSLPQCQGITSQTTAAQYLAQHPELELERLVCTPQPSRIMQERRA